ncbi:MAG: Rdx family protein [Natronomonas sp.]
MTTVSVEYCAPCRAGGAAVETRRALTDHLRKYSEVEEVTLTPSSEEVFCVSIDGERVWCSDPSDRVDPMEAVAAVRSQLSAASPEVEP